MGLETVAREMLDATIVTKNGRCKQENGPVDLMPLLHVLTKEKKGMIAIIPNREFILAAMALMVPPELHPTYVAFCADAYVRFQPVSGDPPLPLGKLAELRENGDMTVTDALIVTVMDFKTGEIVVLQQPYIYNDVGQPVYQDIVTYGVGHRHMDETSGVIVELRKLRDEWGDER